MIYHAFDCLATAAEISNASLIDNKFTELMSHFTHNLTLSKETTPTQTLSVSMAESIGREKAPVQHLEEAAMPDFGLHGHHVLHA